MASKTRKKSEGTPAPAETDSKKLTQKQKNYIYTGVFLTIILFLFVVNNYNGEPEEGPYPPHYLESLQNNLKLSDYRGKVVLLNFWASWDENSRKSTPGLIELKNFYKTGDFEIISVSLDGATQNGQSKNDVGLYIDEFGINYPVVHGTKKTMSDYGGVSSLPAIFILDKIGNIVAHHQGLVDKITLINDIKLAFESNAGEVSLEAPDFNLPRVETDK
jgi:thiol-disulfide isomerase/thioredoxin